MSDPLGLIGSQLTPPALPLQRPGRPAGPGDGPSFADSLRAEIDRVNRLQQDARAAVDDLAAGRRDDVESVMMATEKADTAFRMLLAVRNKMMDAYREVKDLRI